LTRLLPSSSATRDKEGKWSEGGALGKLSKPVNEGSVAQVGAISANGDQEIGDIIAEAVKVVGKDGVITIEESKTMRTDLGDRRRHAV